MEWIFGDDKDALEEKWFEGFNRALLNDNPQDVIDSLQSEIRELREKLGVAESIIKKMDCDCGFDTHDGYQDTAVCFRCEALEKLRSGK